VGRNIYYDTEAEADNLLPKVTTLHCIVCEDIDTGEKFYFGPPVVDAQRHVQKELTSGIIPH
jgi:hypothetical protein